MKRKVSQFRRSAMANAMGRWLPKLAIPALALIVIILAVTHHLPGQSPSRGSSATQLPRNALVADFGLQRVSLTRSVLVSTGSATVATPTILTARLSSDLTEAGRLGQFPADQITLTATPAGPSQIEIVAILNPINPYKVADGFFTGSISVYTGSKILSVPIVVHLAPKSGYRALLAFLLLLLGAIFGLSVKWVTEALSSLASARWRFDDISKAFEKMMDTLPNSVGERLEEIKNRIRRQDLVELDGLFHALDAARGSLAEFSNLITKVNEDIDHQSRQREKLRGLPVDPVVRVERQHVKELLSQQWPWADDDKIFDEAKLLSVYVKDAAGAMEKRNSSVLSLYAADRCGEAYKLSTGSDGGKSEDIAAIADATSTGPPDASSPDHPDQLPGQDSPAILRGERRLTLFDGRSPIRWMTERPRTLVAAASILVVAIVGLQVQYLNSTSFDGSLAEWLSLLLWAAVIELSGVSVLDVIGRLSGGGSAPRRP
jgi:hypothetical protein